MSHDLRASRQDTASDPAARSAEELERAWEQVLQGLADRQVTLSETPVADARRRLLVDLCGWRPELLQHLGRGASDTGLVNDLFFGGSASLAESAACLVLAPLQLELLLREVPSPRPGQWLLLHLAAGMGTEFRVGDLIRCARWCRLELGKADHLPSDFHEELDAAFSEIERTVSEQMLLWTEVGFFETGRRGAPWHRVPVRSAASLLPVTERQSGVFFRMHNLLTLALRNWSFAELSRLLSLVDEGAESEALVQCEVSLPLLESSLAQVSSATHALLSAFLLGWYARKSGDTAPSVRTWAESLLEIAHPATFSRPEDYRNLEIASRGLLEFFLYFRQRGDATVRDAIAARAQQLTMVCVETEGPRVAAAASRLWFIVASTQFVKGERTSAMLPAQRSVECARLAARQDLMARHSSVLAFLELDAGQHLQGLRRLQESAAILESLGATDEWAATMGNLTTLLYQYGAVDMAWDTALRAWEVMRHRDDLWLNSRLLVALIRLGDILQISDVLHFQTECLRIAGTLQDPGTLADAHIRIGWHRLLRTNGPPELALSCFERALAVEYRGGRERMQTYAMHAMAEALALLDRRSEAFEHACATLTLIPESRVQHRVEVQLLCAAMAPTAEEGHARLREAREWAQGVDSFNLATLIDIETVFLAVRDQPAGAGKVFENEPRLLELWGRALGPQAPPFGTRGVERPAWQRTSSLWAAARRTVNRISPEWNAEAEARGWWKPGTLLVSDAGMRIRLPSGERVVLEKMPILARLLDELARARVDTADGVCTLERFLEAGWPGEKMLHEAAMNRVYQAISRIRRNCGADVVQAVEGGYRLDPTLNPVAVVRP